MSSKESSNYPKKDIFSGKAILITAGPTIEDIDPVRYITNRSSGKMGVALAEAARDLGANVILIHGPLSVPLPAGLNCIAVRSADDMYQAVMDNINKVQVAIFAAAVADYKPEQKAKNKLKKDYSDLNNIHWVKTVDILGSVSKLSNRPYVVGFAAESENVIQYAKEKLAKKGCDMICANDISVKGLGFESDNNQITIVTNDEELSLSIKSKRELSEEILIYLAKKC